MGGFLSSIFTGSNPTLAGNISKFGQQAGFASGIGQNDTTEASNWYSSLLSGDPTKEAQAIAPETAALQEQEQQAKNQRAEFSPRSGGTAAADAGADAATRGDIFKLLGSLKSGAAGNLSSIGQSEQGIGLEAEKMQDDASQQQMQNYENSILGKGISKAASFGETAGLLAI